MREVVVSWVTILKSAQEPLMMNHFGSLVGPLVTPITLLEGGLANGQTSCN
jgi:hypothetical protein